jgi:hypothetical protein
MPRHPTQIPPRPAPGIPLSSSRKLARRIAAKERLLSDVRPDTDLYAQVQEELVSLRAAAKTAPVVESILKYYRKYIPQ